MLVLLLCAGASAAGVCVSVLVLNAGTCAGAGAAGVRSVAGDAGTGLGFRVWHRRRKRDLGYGRCCR